MPCSLTGVISHRAGLQVWIQTTIDQTLGSVHGRGPRRSASGNVSKMNMGVQREARVPMQGCSWPCGSTCLGKWPLAWQLCPQAYSPLPAPRTSVHPVCVAQGTPCLLMTALQRLLHRSAALLPGSRSLTVPRQPGTRTRDRIEPVMPPALLTPALCAPLATSLRSRSRSVLDSATLSISPQCGQQMAHSLPQVP